MQGTGAEVTFTSAAYPIKNRTKILVITLLEWECRKIRNSRKSRNKTGEKNLAERRVKKTVQDIR